MVQTMANMFQRKISELINGPIKREVINMTEKEEIKNVGEEDIEKALEGATTSTMLVAIQQMSEIFQQILTKMNNLEYQQWAIVSMFYDVKDGQLVMKSWGGMVKTFINAPQKLQDYFNEKQKLIEKLIQKPEIVDMLIEQFDEKMINVMNKEE